MSEILKAWEKIKSITRIAVTGKVDPDLIGIDEEHIKKQISECVYAKGGEVSSRSRSVEVGKTYLKLSSKGRQKFMKILAREFDTDNDQLNKIIEALRDSENVEQKIKYQMELARTLVPPRVKLLKQFSTLPNGFKFLIDFRADLLPIRKEDPHLVKLDMDLRNLLSSWFDIGLLNLTEITWQSPASMLEKLIEYEAVHEIQSWTDLKNRLDSDRYCFAFFHIKIPDEPLIFVQVALVNSITDKIHKILDETATTIKPEEADTAIFYSISNAQKGLSGINLGNFLIKRVVNELSRKWKGLKHFATLSPIPNFRKWLDPLLLQGDETILTKPEIKSLRSVTNNINAAKGLIGILNSDWREEAEFSKTIKPVLMRLCAYYLLEVKREEKAFDPVANFHLTNGARVERLNWLGDTSPKGMIQSAGIMVNYYYNFSEIEKNHETYISESQINTSKEIKKLIK
jgi:malonyl-CoA decarboxylase